MHSLPTPMQTSVARQWLEARDTRLDRVERALLATIDGHRNIVELESVARAMGLDPATFEHLRLHGLIDFPVIASVAEALVACSDH